jgi:hypothetical protein
MEEKMKVQMPGEEVIEGCRALSRLFDEPIKKRDYHLGFRDAIDHINEQFAKDQPPSPTKRPFLSDLEIDTMWGTDACRQGARWARDKYEARDGGIAPTPKKVLRPVGEILDEANRRKQLTVVQNVVSIIDGGQVWYIADLLTQVVVEQNAPEWFFTTEEPNR